MTKGAAIMISGDDLEEKIAKGVEKGIITFLINTIIWPFKAAWWLTSLPVKVLVVIPTQFISTALLWRYYSTRLCSAEVKLRQKLGEALKNHPGREEILKAFDENFEQNSLLPAPARAGLIFSRWIDIQWQNVKSWVEKKRKGGRSE